MPTVEPISPLEWKAFSENRIIFGHQSVGNDILSGIEALAEKSGVDLIISKSRNSSENAGMTHFEIGRNENPASKMEDFEDAFRDGNFHVADIAMMKLCYVDIRNDTDVKKLAQEYVATIDRLSRKYPGTIFIAVTVPLTTLQEGPKAWVKLLLGKKPSGYVENYHRLEFNNILRNKYGPQDRLFDLAKFEAEGAENYDYRGLSVEMLNPEFTTDGGHLNSLGQQYIAAKLIKYLACFTRQ
jgi:hypothetical protein